MRRFLALLVVAGLFLPAVSVVAKTENVRDDFGEVSYSGNDGSLDFSAPWSEIGESDGPASGQVSVADRNCSNNRCLQLRGGLVEAVGASRAADLSPFSNATLQFDLQMEAAPLLSTATFYVEVRGKGTGWKTLKSYSLLLEAGEYSEQLDVSAYAGSDFQLRFRLTNLLGEDRVYVDRVNMEGPVSATTTSSSTTTTTTSSSSSTTSTSTSSSTTSTTTSTATTSTSTTTTTRGTTSTDGSSTTSTTVPRSTTTIGGTSGTSTTTTSSPAFVLRSPASPPGDGGLRQSGVGLMADYRSGMMGDIGPYDIEVLGAELEADFSLAVEAIEAARIWIAILALIIAAAVVSGMDWRRSKVSPND